ncbi:unnamed protein product [Rotaria socialis]|uniref:G-protein coupled receptors family 3 profile domain-containing protein n=1 Tax=Rotaria socialis TaxID=392032 RepID=A0A820EMQ1_9BILA|nr:unnamed protein product [Rotaria socialis]CAF3287926.1 unnamed protein product [Rotaria socialis]CAF4251037.1 unnamed protein product [Rotaria socialis]CAF4348895.1 unnamed protein product [Rotaria socialis]
MNRTMKLFNSSMLPTNLLYDSSDFNDNSIENHSSSSRFLALNDSWILPIFIVCLFGILCTIIISFLLICLSHRRLNGHFLLTHLFICFSVCFLYIIIIIFLIRANEIFCGLREFLSQLGYALLYSSLLCRYIMQWLGSRILSKRTKQLTALLIYLLLIFIQIPIGILWWYFTVPRVCQHQTLNILSSKLKGPKFRIDFRKPITLPLPSSSSSVQPCSNRCTVDYRFYATFTYTMLELIFCTTIATCLFFYRQCHRTNTERDKEKTISINGNNSTLTFLHMLAYFLIDLVWLLWSFIYYFMDAFFVFPSLIIGMFLIATICLLFILLPQIYYYSKLPMNDINSYKSSLIIQPTALYSNKLAAVDDINDHELLLEENSPNQKLNREKQEQILSSGSELSYEIGTSGTFLPITRTPKGPFKVKVTDQIRSIEKIENLTYQEHPNTQTTSNNQYISRTNDEKTNQSMSDMRNQKEQRLQASLAPLQRNQTSSSIASDFIAPVVTRSLRHRTDSHESQNFDIHSPSSMYYTGYPPPRRDESIIPILCNTERPRTSTPLQIRLLTKSSSSSAPLARRIHAGSDLRHVQRPYQRFYPPPPPPPTTPPYYSPQPQQYLFVDPYRTMRSGTSSSLWQSLLLQPDSAYHRYPYSSRRHFMGHRSLSQRLWDIDSGDDENEVEEDIVKVAGRVTPNQQRPYDFRFNSYENENNLLLHIDDNDDEREN